MQPQSYLKNNYFLVFSTLLILLSLACGGGVALVQSNTQAEIEAAVAARSRGHGQAGFVDEGVVGFHGARRRRLHGGGAARGQEAGDQLSGSIRATTRPRERV